MFVCVLFYVFNWVVCGNGRQLAMVLPEGVTLTVVMDCCHSGSILDLPYTIKADEGTIAAVEAGESTSMLGANPNFSFMKASGK